MAKKSKNTTTNPKVVWVALILGFLLIVLMFLCLRKREGFSSGEQMVSVTGTDTVVDPKTQKYEITNPDLKFMGLIPPRTSGSPFLLALGPKRPPLTEWLIYPSPTVNAFFLMSNDNAVVLSGEKLIVKPLTSLNPLDTTGHWEFIPMPDGSAQIKPLTSKKLVDSKILQLVEATKNNWKIKRL